MKKLLSILLLALSFNCIAQTTVDTTIDGWKAILTRPAGYFDAANSSVYYPMLVFFPGAGEAGGSYAQLRQYGPHAYISNGGWDGRITLDGTSYSVIIVSLSQVPSFDVNGLSKTRLNTLNSFLRVKFDGIMLTGLSAGGQVPGILMSEDAFDNTAPYGPFTYADNISAVASCQGVQPDDNADYLNKIKNYVRNNVAGRYLGIWGTSDGSRQMPTMADSMNAAVANSAVVLSRPYGHDASAFNAFYGNSSAPENNVIDGINQTAYQWMLRQTDTTADTPPIGCTDCLLIRIRN